jgi:ribosome-binding protein aMBF1 (putative translation factor)
MGTQTIHLNGKAYVILEQQEYERLAALAREAALPPYPEPDARGNYPAVAYCRVSIARDIIRDRLAAGLSQRELARLAGIRFETLRRIEAANYTAPPRTIEKIDRALERAKNGQRQRKPPGQRKTR